MFRQCILLGFICTFIFKTPSLEAQEQRAVSSSSKGGTEPQIDVLCIGALHTEMTISAALEKMGLSPFPKMKDAIGAFAIKVLWDKDPAMREIFKKYANEIHYVRSNNLKEGDNSGYREEIVSAILDLIQTLAEQTMGTVELPLNDGSFDLSKDKIDRLTYQIKQFEKLIDQLDTMSPIESLIYTNIVEGAIEYLKDQNNTFDVSEFDFEQYVTRKYEEELKDLTLSPVLRSVEQRRYFLQQYQFLRRYSNHVTNIMHPSQDSFTQTEQEMREQGYSEDFIKGFDNAKTNLKLAQDLRTRSIDPIRTHIPEFTELIDEHINFIRKGIMDSQDFSDIDKARRLELLDILQSKAQSYRDAEKITYLWWFNFNLHLSIVATSDSDLFDPIKTHTPEFDERINFIREGIMDSQNLSDVDKARLKSLDVLQSEVQSYSRDNDLSLLIFKKHDDNIDFDFLKEWMINDDGSDLFKLASIFKIFDKFKEYQSSPYRSDNNDIVSSIDSISNELGLNMTFEDIKELDIRFEDDSLLILELARRINLELDIGAFEELRGDEIDIKAFYSNTFIGSFIYLFNHFPQKVMLPTISQLGTISINMTYMRGVHLLGLVNRDTEADGRRMSPLRFFLHDVGHLNIRIDDIEKDIENYNLPKALKELMEHLYFEVAHEAQDDIVGLIQQHQQEQEQVLFQFIRKLGNLTELEELELRKVILVLTYLEFMQDKFSTFSYEKVYETLKVILEVEQQHRGLEFTEENIDNPAIFTILILRLYGLYEQEQRLFETLNSN